VAARANENVSARLLSLLLAALCLWQLHGCRERAPAATGGQRIAVLSPAVALIVKGLGHEGDIVGRHAWDRVLDQRIAVCGDQAGIDYEALLTARPTHVLTQWGSRTLPPRLAELAQANGWKLHDSRLLSLNDIIASTKELDAMLGETAGGELGKDLLARMDRAWSVRGKGFGPVGRVLLLASVSPPSALGPGSCHDDILRRIGGVPAIAQGSAYIELDYEDIVRLAPDAVVLVLPRTKDDSEGQAGSPLSKFTGLDIPAARAGRMAVIDDPLSHTPSTPMIDFADNLARVLERWNGPQPTAVPGP